MAGRQAEASEWKAASHGVRGAEAGILVGLHWLNRHLRSLSLSKTRFPPQ